jgi:thymidine kinase
MGAGKTTEAFRLVDSALASGRRVHILKHIRDCRYEDRQPQSTDAIINAEVVTHLGERRHAYAVEDLRAYWGHPRPGDLVWVEEAHFFMGVEDTVSAW